MDAQGLGVFFGHMKDFFRQSCIVAGLLSVFSTIETEEEMALVKTHV